MQYTLSGISLSSSSPPPGLLDLQSATSSIQASSCVCHPLELTSALSFCVAVLASPRALGGLFQSQFWDWRTRLVGESFDVEQDGVRQRIAGSPDVSVEALSCLWLKPGPTFRAGLKWEGEWEGLTFILLCGSVLRRGLPEVRMWPWVRWLSSVRLFLTVAEAYLWGSLWGHMCFIPERGSSFPLGESQCPPWIYRILCWYGAGQASQVALVVKNPPVNPQET